MRRDLGTLDPSVLGAVRSRRPAAKSAAEGFNGELRDDCLNEHWLLTLGHAKAVIAAWRTDDNEQRPHSSLDDLTPSEYAAAVRTLSSTQTETLANQNSVK